MKFNVLLIILIVIALASAFSFTGYYILANVQHEKVFNVTRVIDGDTIEIQTGERVRLLGINAPDKGEYYYQEAKNRLTEILEGKQVRLDFGPVDKDLYNRSLRYIFLNNTLIDVEMVKEGLANIYILSPDEKYYLEFEKAENYAKNAKLGIWNTSSLNGCIVISTFHYDAAGDDSKNLNDEYVVFRNVCNITISLRDWIVRDSGRTKYVFGKFSIQPNASFTLFSGYGTDTKDKVYWDNKKSVWKNSGDTLFLWDKNGNLVLSYSYP